MILWIRLQYTVKKLNLLIKHNINMVNMLSIKTIYVYGLTVIFTWQDEIMTIGMDSFFD